MSASESVSQLFSESVDNDKIFTIGVTVDTGFEWEAIDECKEKLGKDVRVVKQRGRIYFNIDWDEFPKVQEMRSIDHIFIVADNGSLSFTNDKEPDLLQIRSYNLDILSNSDKTWKKTLEAWKCATSFKGKLYPTNEEYVEAKKEDLVAKTEMLEMRNKEKGKKDPYDWNVSEMKEEKGKKRGQDPSKSQENDILKYRVTCERSGKHAIESKDVARVIGEILQDKFHWLVDLSMYHLEIVCKLIDDQLITHLRVTHKSKHHRNIINFGPTTLRSTICYNLLKLANPKLGDIIVDPMCGGGSIPIEAALAFPHLYVLCGDNDSRATDRTKSNMDASAVTCKIDLVQWTASKLPFKDSFVDIIVTDMPFGKRSGNKSYNKIFYKKFLLEFGRIVKSNGRIILLTYDRNNFKDALMAAGDLFWVIKIIGVNVGGLPAAVYVLNRTQVALDSFKPRVAKQYSYPRDNKNSSHSTKNPLSN
ncbi:PREDICTED: THUMP domain-containing protein 3-like [Trachymyrmex cornetzi]|uniref:THUMP domain-containing protein 3 n=1 Tax=Trachymyrmex cornetzi TaxID=471704 RepID=A0A151J7Q7_9HYME|nr:PREDICTED: THUMP domain-containing protein 3-like [Trachymyrmex cornetzi]KYN20046.1 THUMP domain-containing protein 3 [Trachymyrmex cornetzi]